MQYRPMDGIMNTNLEPCPVLSTGNVCVLCLSFIWINLFDVTSIGSPKFEWFFWLLNLCCVMSTIVCPFLLFLVMVVSVCLSVFPFTAFDYSFGIFKKSLIRESTDREHNDKMPKATGQTKIYKTTHRKQRSTKHHTENNDLQKTRFLCGVL
jgi:hypothetical protein